MKYVRPCFYVMFFAIVFTNAKYAQPFSESGQNEVLSVPKDTTMSTELNQKSKTKSASELKSSLNSPLTAIQSRFRRSFSPMKRSDDPNKFLQDQLRSWLLSNNNHGTEKVTKEQMEVHHLLNYLNTPNTQMHLNDDSMEYEEPEPIDLVYYGKHIDSMNNRNPNKVKPFSVNVKDADDYDASWTDEHEEYPVLLIHSNRRKHTMAKRPLFGGLGLFRGSSWDSKVRKSQKPPAELRNTATPRTFN